MKKVVTFVFVVIMMLVGQYPSQADEGNKVKVISADNTEYVLSDFVFLSDHRPFEGQFYTPCSANNDHGIIVQNGVKSYVVEGKDIKSINMARSNSTQNFEGVTIDMVNGNKISGTVLVDSWNTWLVYSNLWCQGSVSVLGKKGTYNETLDNIKSISNNPEQDGKFDIFDNEDHKTTVSDLHFGLTLVCPLADLDVIGLTNEVGFVVDRINVNVAVGEIQKIDFSNNRMLSVHLKTGENSKATFETVTRIKGDLGPGEVLFTPIFDDEGKPKIKSIVFDIPN